MKKNKLIIVKASLIVFLNSCGNPGIEKAPAKNDSTQPVTETVAPDANTDWKNEVASKLNISAKSLLACTLDDITDLNILDMGTGSKVLGSEVTFEAGGKIKCHDYQNGEHLWPECGSWKFENDLIIANMNGVQKKIALFEDLSSKKNKSWFVYDTESKEIGNYFDGIGE